MWSGPNSPRGAYSFPTHYFDGTSIYDEDFHNRHYPNNRTGYHWYPYTKETSSEEDLFKMVPPSMSCSSTMLPANDDVFRNTGSSEDGDLTRSVVCKGKYYLLNIVL